jgi:hypothetical protein
MAISFSRRTLLHVVSYYSWVDICTSHIKQICVSKISKCVRKKVIISYSCDSSVGVVTGYGMDDRMVGVRFLAVAGNFSIHHRVQTGSGAQPASYTMGSGSSFPGSKAAGAWNWPFISTCCRDQRMRRALPPLPHYVFMAWRLVKHRDNLTFTFINNITMLYFYINSIK